MVNTRKFSEFADGGDLINGDTTVGISGSANAKFNNPWTFLPSGTTAERPAPSAEMEWRLRLNTTTTAYEYYNPTIPQWVVLEDDVNLLALLASHAAGEGASLIGLENQGTIVNKTVQDLSEANFICGTNNGTTVNAQYLHTLATGIMSSTTGMGLVATRTLTGTANQVNIADGDGTANPTFSLSSTIDAPGTLTVQGTVAIDSIIDDDTMATATATNVPTAESVVAYIAATPGGAGGSNTEIQYNNAGTLDGDSGFTTDGAGSLTVVGDLSVDNLNLNANTLSSTNTNGDITLNPDGTGEINLSADIVNIDDKLDFGSNWRLESEDVGSVTRLLTRGFAGGNENAELALVPIGAAVSSRLLLTDNPNLNNYESVELRINNTESALDSNAVGTGTALPLKLQYDGTDVATIATDGRFTLDADLNANTNQIKNVVDPTAAQDAATKKYVDDTSQGRHFKSPALAASTGDFTSTYDNGASGVGATLTATSNGAFSLDGEAGVSNGRYLMKNQTATEENGIYTLTQVGDAGNPAILTRAVDMDVASEFQFATVYVQNGATNGGRIYTETDAVTTVGTDAVTFVQTGDATTGVVNTGTQNELAYYAANGNEVSGLTSANNGILVTSAGGVPSIGNTIGASISVTGTVTASTGFAAGANALNTFATSTSPTSNSFTITKSYASTTAQTVLQITVPASAYFIAFELFISTSRSPNGDIGTSCLAKRYFSIARNGSGSDVVLDSAAGPDWTATTTTAGGAQNSAVATTIVRNGAEANTDPQVVNITLDANVGANGCRAMIVSTISMLGSLTGFSIT